MSVKKSPKQSLFWNFTYKLSYYYIVQYIEMLFTIFKNFLYNSSFATTLYWIELSKFEYLELNWDEIRCFFSFSSSVCHVLDFSICDYIFHVLTSFDLHLAWYIYKWPWSQLALCWSSWVVELFGELPCLWRILYLYLSIFVC